MQGEEYLPLGYILSPHGIKGHVILKTFSGEGTSLLRGIFLSIKTNKKGFINLKILESRPYKKGFLVKFEGIDDRNSAEELVDSEVLIKRKDLPETEEHEYYWVDLIGCNVFTINDKFIGKVESLIETGGVDVIVVRDGKKEFLFPFSENVVKKVDINEKKIIIDESAFENF
ncbi:MAG: ribosome maturation factor RimM [Proteobacteria bacterium]|nr:ribosome maturation factor RimM [Pseudomonadota bacterium]